MSDCPREGGGCPTMVGLIVTVLIAIVAAALLSSFAGTALPMGGLAGEALNLAIVTLVIICAIAGLRAFRNR